MVRADVDIDKRALMDAIEEEAETWFVGSLVDYAIIQEKTGASVGDGIQIKSQPYLEPAVRDVSNKNLSLAAAGKDLNDVIGETAEIIAKTAKPKAPVDRGNLRNSIAAGEGYEGYRDASERALRKDFVARSPKTGRELNGPEDIIS